MNIKFNLFGFVIKIT